MLPRNQTLGWRLECRMFTRECSRDRSGRSVWPAEGPLLCLTCPTSGSSTWWAWTRGRPPTGSSRPMSAGPQVRSPGGPRFPTSVQPQALRRDSELTLSSLGSSGSWLHPGAWPWVPVSRPLCPPGRALAPGPSSFLPSSTLCLLLHPPPCPHPHFYFVPDRVPGSKSSEQSPGAAEPVHFPP